MKRNNINIKFAHIIFIFFLFFLPRFSICMISINLYDEWIIFNTNNSNLPDDRIDAIAIDNNESNIWIGTERGLAKLNCETLVIEEFDIKKNIHALTIDNNGFLWIGTTFELIRFDGEQFKFYDTQNSGLLNNCIRALSVDSYGNLWIGCSNGPEEPGGLLKFDGTNWANFSNKITGLPDNMITTIYNDTLGNTWVGSYFGGLSMFNGTEWIVYHEGNKTPMWDRVADIVMDSNNDIWTGATMGLVKFHAFSWKNYRFHNTGLPIDIIFSIAYKQGKLWVGATDDDFNGGLIKFDGVNWVGYNTLNSQLPYTQINTIEIDTYGNKWLGTGRGLAVFREGGVIFTADDEITEDILHSKYKLYQNYPNPFNNSTKIEYILSDKKKNYNVRLQIYDIYGQLVKQLVNQKQNSGHYVINWNGINANAKTVSSGIYFCILNIDEIKECFKMTYIK